VSVDRDLTQLIDAHERLISAPICWWRPQTRDTQRHAGVLTRPSLHGARKGAVAKCSLGGV